MIALIGAGVKPLRIGPRRGGTPRPCATTPAVELDGDAQRARPDRFNCPFTISADHLDDGAREGNLDLEALIDSVLDFARPSVRDAGQTALNLVDEAADVFRRMEDHARETEEKLRLAEMRAEAQHELVIETERMLQD